MNRRWSAAVFALGVAASCGGKIDTSGDGGQVDAAVSGTCCLPAPGPMCCMALGGWIEGSTCTFDCHVPTPDTPGWKQGTDAHGCAVWLPPPTATSFCDDIPDASTPPPCPTPADVSTFTPPAFVPSAVQKGACTSQQIQQMFDACFSSTATATTCQSFQQANPTCAGCILPSPPTQGPLLQQSSGIIALDIAGCVAIVTGDSSPTSCAARFQDNLACQEAACDAQCPVVDQQSFQLYEACTQNAEAGGCSKYAQAQCPLDGGAAGQCEAVTDFQTSYVYIASLFCGP